MFVELQDELGNVYYVNPSQILWIVSNDFSKKSIVNLSNGSTIHCNIPVDELVSQIVSSIYKPNIIEILKEFKR